MGSSLMRKAVALSLPLIAFLAVGDSSAQTTTNTTTSTSIGTATKLSSSDFSMYLERYNNGNWIQMNDTETKYFFNRARCECGAAVDPAKKFSQFFKVAIVPATNTSQKITTILQSSATPGFQGDGRLYAAASGTGCLDVNTTSSVVLPSVCTNLLDSSHTYAQGFLLTKFSNSGPRLESPEIPVAWLFGSILNPTCGATGTCDAPANCTTAQSAATIFFWAQSTPGLSPDFNDEVLSVNVVGAAPTSPTLLPPKGGNEALIVSWQWPDGFSPSNQSTSFLGLQVFCRRGADTPVFKKGTYGPAYTTARDLCPASNPDLSSYGEFEGLDPKYLCSGLVPPSATSYRITGLQNDIYYGVGVAVVDRYGNVSPITDVRYEKPIATVDFYDEYRDAGGKAEGGFCSLGGWRGKPGVLGLAGLAVLALVMVRRGRRRGDPPGGAVAMVLLVSAAALAAHPARAYAFLDDMDVSPDENKDAYIIREPTPPPPPRPPPTWTGTERDFALELRFGLYTPNVDSEFSGSGARPNSLLFGNSRRPMWQMEFDWEFLQRFGTLAVGASIGYWKENASACYRAELTAGQGCKPSGDNTSLRLIPFAALLVYRMDEAAKRWRIPLVPYGKIGLNYTIWTVSDGNGEVPNYPTGGHGQGGTAGWQAAVGLALQLDFIDSGTARAFDAESGVNHTYAFFELAHVDGAGLYRSNVLRVGDNTWFAGLMFEF